MMRFGKTKEKTKDSKDRGSDWGETAIRGSTLALSVGVNGESASVDMISTSNYKTSKKGKNREKEYGTDWMENTVQGGAVVLALVKEAAQFAPVPGLQQAAGTALQIVTIVQAVKDNKIAFQRLAEDATNIIAAVWRSYQASANQKEWPPSELKDVINELVTTLNDIAIFVEQQLSRSSVRRVMFSTGDVAKVREYRERIQAAVAKFEVSSHLNINDILCQVLKKQIEITEQLSNRGIEVEQPDAQKIFALIARSSDNDEKDPFEDDVHQHATSRTAPVARQVVEVSPPPITTRSVGEPPRSRGVVNSQQPPRSSRSDEPVPTVNTVGEGYRTSNAVASPRGETSRSLGRPLGGSRPLEAPVNREFEESYSHAPHPVIPLPEEISHSYTIHIDESDVSEDDRGQSNPNPGEGILEGIIRASPVQDLNLSEGEDMADLMAAAQRNLAKEKQYLANSKQIDPQDPHPAPERRDTITPERNDTGTTFSPERRDTARYSPSERSDTAYSPSERSDTLYSTPDRRDTGASSPAQRRDTTGYSRRPPKAPSPRNRRATVESDTETAFDDYEHSEQDSEEAEAEARLEAIRAARKKKPRSSPTSGKGRVPTADDERLRADIANMNLDQSRPPGRSPRSPGGPEYPASTVPYPAQTPHSPFPPYIQPNHYAGGPPMYHQPPMYPPNYPPYGYPGMYGGYPPVASVNSGNTSTINISNVGNDNSTKIIKTRRRRPPGN